MTVLPLVRCDLCGLTREPVARFEALGGPAGCWEVCSPACAELAVQTWRAALLGATARPFPSEAKA